MRLARNMALLLLSGLAVEAAILPIGLYHFHKAGIYGSMANIISIPLTTLVIMPIEALALLLDLIGLGEPLWSLAGISITALINIAKFTSSLPGAMAALPTLPILPFGLMVASGIWLCLWRGSARLAGILVFVPGAVMAFATPSPDLLITGDGRHVAITDGRDRFYLLRPRAGDYVRDTISGVSARHAPDAIEGMPGAQCNADMCLADIDRAGRRWRVLATRSPYYAPWRVMIRACADADIVISDRFLPRACMPRWLKADRKFLEKNGGLMIYFSENKVISVRPAHDDHPWIRINPASYRQ